MFKAASERGRTNAAKNRYPHRLGSGGYKNVKAKWRTDKTPLPSSSSGSGLSQDEIDRAYWWYLARTSVHPVTGERYYLDEATQHAFDRLVNLFQ